MNDFLLIASDKKNNAKSRIDYIEIDESMALAKLANPETAETLSFRAAFHTEWIQFYFCQNGSASFAFHGGRYKIDLDHGKSYMFYNPENALSYELVLAPQSKVLAIFITVSQLHKLFLNDGDQQLSFLDPSRIEKKYYAEGSISSMLSIVIDQFFSMQMPENMQSLYYRGKVLEALSLHFTKDEKNEDACPFLISNAHAEKIREAKTLIIKEMKDPPTLKDLAKAVGLNEYQLKAGFKNVYGTTVYQYLGEYKMRHARKLLDTGDYQVAEVGYQIGYNNSSHFIAAFKKKYGLTPKKYLTFKQG